MANCYLRNIVEIDGEPLLFDCLDRRVSWPPPTPSTTLRSCLMDLWQRDLRPLSNLVNGISRGHEIPGLPPLAAGSPHACHGAGDVLATQAVRGGLGLNFFTPL